MNNIGSHLIKTIVTAILLTALGACDPAYPIFIRNGLSVPVTARISYADGVISDAILQPGERLALMHTRGDVEAIVVLSADRELYRLDKQTLQNMQTSVPNVRQMTWNIQSDEIVPLTRSQIQNLQSTFDK